MDFILSAAIWVSSLTLLALETKMANYIHGSELTAYQPVLSEVGNRRSETQIPFVVLEGGLADDMQCLGGAEGLASCCPLGESVRSIQKILQSLSTSREKPLEPARLMRTLYRLVESVDRGYANLEQLGKAEMAGLQLKMIDESNEREALVSILRSVVGPEDCAEVVSQLLAESGNLKENSISETMVLIHPEIATVAQSLVKHKRPVAERFQQLQQQMNHASKHRVTARKEIAEALKKYGMARISRKMKIEAVSIEMGW